MYPNQSYGHLIAGFQRLGEQQLQDPAEREEEADLGHPGGEPGPGELLRHAGAQDQPLLRAERQVRRLPPSALWLDCGRQDVQLDPGRL